MHPYRYAQRRFRRRKATEGDAGIVTALYGDVCVFHGGKVYAVLGQGNGRGGAEGDTHYKGGAVCHACLYAAGVVAFKNYSIILHPESVIGLRATHGGKGSACAELYSLYAGYGVHEGGNAALKAAPQLAAQANGKAQGAKLSAAANGIPIEGAKYILHALLCCGGDNRERTFPKVSQLLSCGVEGVKGSICNIPYAKIMPPCGYAPLG